MKLIVLNLVLKIIKLQGKAVINGGWRWGWLFSGSCGPLLKQQPGQVGDKVDAPSELDIIALCDCWHRSITVDNISNSLH